MQVRPRSVVHAREVVVVGQVHRAVAVGGASTEADGVVQMPAMHVGAERGDRSCGVVRAGKTEDLVSGGEQLGYDGRADPPGCSGNEDAHENSTGRPGREDTVLEPW